MSIQETYQWAKETASQLEKFSKEESRANKVAALKKFQFSNNSFFGDVTIKEGDIFFHFFPSNNSISNLCLESPSIGKYWVFSHAFMEAVTDAFLLVFKHEDRIFQDFVPELNSYVIRCAGFGDNPLQEEMIERVLVRIKEKYEQ